MDTSKLPTINFIVRGVGYALTSALAMLSGFLIGTKAIQLSDVVLLLMLIALSVPFFISYAICFHYQHDLIAKNEEQLRSLQKESLIHGHLYALFIYVILILLYDHIQSTFPSIEYLVSTLFLGIVFFSGYALFLYLRFTDLKEAIIRHQLVWPTILTIAISLYFGLFFDSVKHCTNVYFALPVGLILIYFIISETFRFTKKTFLVSGLCCFFVLSLVTLFAKLDLIPALESQSLDFSAILFCLTTAAYLAVFEAWRITSDIANREYELSTIASLNQAMQSQQSVGNEASFYSTTKSYQYSIATLAAILVSGLLVPSVFIFSSYGTIFLYGFFVNSVFAFILWYNTFQNPKSIREYDWIKRKLLFGFTFLAILVIDSKFNLQPADRTMPQFVSWSGLSFLFAVAAAPTYRFLRELKDFLEKRKDEKLYKLFTNKLNFVRSMSFISFIICTFILIMQDLTGSQLFLFKADHAYIVYSVVIVGSLIIEGISFLWPSTSKNASFKSLLGFLQTTRIPTSTFIGLVVFLPSFAIGNTIMNSLLSAVPFFFAAMGGFALNDYFDIEKDRINKPDRAIPSGKMSPTSVLCIAICWLVTAILLAVQQSHSRSELIIYFITIGGVSIYNVIVKHIGVFKTFFTAALCSMPVLYDTIIFEYPSLYLSLPVATLAFIVGREFLMDARDLEGDKLANILTIPMILGKALTVKLGFLLQIIGVVILLPLVIFGSSLLQAIVLFFITISVLAALIFWNYNSGKFQRHIILLLWIPMLLGISILLV